MTPEGAFLLGAILTGLLWLWCRHIGSGLWADLKARWSERGGRQGGFSSPRWNRPSRSGFRGKSREGAQRVPPGTWAAAWPRTVRRASSLGFRKVAPPVDHHYGKDRLP